MGRAGVPQKTTARAMDALAWQDTGLRSQDRARADLDMFGDAYLAADDRAIRDSAAAGDAGLRRDHDVAADGDVVSHVDKIVELRAAADPCLFERSTVDRGVRADFDIVLDDEACPAGEISCTRPSRCRARSRNHPSQALRPRGP